MVFVTMRPCLTLLQGAAGPAVTTMQRPFTVGKADCGSDKGCQGEEENGYCTVEHG